jgi:hypothetical protein
MEHNCWYTIGRTLFLAAAVWFASGHHASAQVIPGTFDVTFPRAPSLRIKSGDVECSPATLSSSYPQPGVTFPTHTMQLGDNARVTYEYLCANILARIIILVSASDEPRIVGPILYPERLAFYREVHFERDGAPDIFEVASRTSEIETSDTGFENGIDLALLNNELLNFPGVRISDIDNMLVDWTTPWD